MYLNQTWRPLPVITSRVAGNGPCLRLEGAQARLAIVAVHIEHPEPRHRSGRNADVAIGLAP